MKMLTHISDRFRKLPLEAKVGIILVGLMFLVALIGRFWTPYDPTATDYNAISKAPSFAHLLGTDDLGRDLLSRIMAGSGSTFTIALFTVMIGLIFGTIIGCLTGYFGGIFDEVIMRINDMLLSFPSVLLALLIISFLGKGTVNVVIALGILFIPSIARIARSEVIRQKGLDFVSSARILGLSKMRIIFVHILPNCRDSLFTAAMIAFNNAVLAEASMSYLGLGVQRPTPSLGRMLSEYQSLFVQAPWCPLFTGIAIILIILSFSLSADAFKKEEKLRKKKQQEKETKVPHDAPNEKEDEVLLRVKDLTIEADDGDRLVDQISFDIPKGRIVGVVGESGSGKSMTALSLMGLLKENIEITGGSIEFMGEDITHISEKEFRELRGDEISMIFQEPMTSLNPVMIIGKQVGESIKLHMELSDEEIRKRVGFCLKDVGLENAEELMEQYPHELSGGMRQRVMIAQAMINSPKLLIADEPTTALDTLVQERILKLLKKIHEETGVSILFISHDLSVIRSIADEVIVMYKGKIVEKGETEKIFTHPENEYTASLVKHPPVVEVPMGEDEVLSVSHMNAWYRNGSGLFSGRKRWQVLKDISFTMQKQEILGIVGESGSGKSSIAKVLTGLNTDHDGTIRFANGIRPQMVFQDPYSSLNPSMSVEKILMEALRGSGKNQEEKRAMVEAMLSDIGLEKEMMTRRITELSGGQRQRVSIGLALLTGSKFLIADEAVSALDVTVQRQILDLLLKLHREKGLSILFISHDLSLVGSFCHRVLVLRNGEIREQGSAKEIYSDPSDPYTKELLEAAGFVKA